MRSSLLRPSAAALLFLACGCGAAPVDPACPKTDVAKTTDPKAPGAPEHPSSNYQILPEDRSPITFDRMATLPEPGWNVPRGVRFSPDKKSLLYLASETAGGLEMALFAFDLDKKASRLVLRAKDLLASDKPLSREEELRRERTRKRITGITEVVLAESANTMVLPVGGDLFLRTSDGKNVQLTKTDEPELDPKLCKNGEKVFFVRGRELFAIDPSGKGEVALTKGAPEGVTHGQTDFNGQEELDEESGYWPAPGCDKVAYLEVDERKVGVHPVLGYRGKKPDLMEQRYPASGEANPSIRIGIVDIKSKKTKWVSVPGDGDRYFARFAWSPDGSALFFESLDRAQKKLTLHRVDSKVGIAADLATVTSPAWVDLADTHMLEKSTGLIWTAERDGHTHLEVRDRATGKVTTQLTKGAWDVTSLQAVDEEQGLVYFTATKDSPVERNLYKVPLAGGDPVRITQDRGVHATQVAPKAGVYVDIHSAGDRPPSVNVRDLTGAIVGGIPIPKDPEIESLKLRPREIVTLKGPSGDTLYANLLRPRDDKPGQKHPVVVIVYGGPGVQTVTDSWAPSLFWQHLADRGFVVWQLDNRGSTGRGPAFEHPIQNELGKVELADQLAGVEYLKTLPFVDPARIGIHGASYGGFMTAYAMLKAPDVFKVGVAAAPVTEWQLYDTAYTERYMGTPKSNATGYDASDLTKLAKNLKGKLLLVHALMDENVHFQNTADLIDAFVAENKPFDLLVYPGERHGYRSPPARKYAARKIATYFAENL